VLLFIPLGVAFSLVALVLLGIGCAPIYPSLIHETPENFGPEKSQAIMGVQMGCAYIGTTCMPVVFGAITNLTGLGLYPVFLTVVLVLMIVVIESLNMDMKK
ncbi:MAG: MFS transporter, partial [Lachnospiraceae bacterium]|nr:MFS transporter [Lachnospiraceae bacterium]